VQGRKQTANSSRPDLGGAVSTAPGLSQEPQFQKRRTKNEDQRVGEGGDRLTRSEKRRALRELRDSLRISKEKGGTRTFNISLTMEATSVRTGKENNRKTEEERLRGGPRISPKKKNVLPLRYHPKRERKSKRAKGETNKAPLGSSGHKI